MSDTSDHFDDYAMGVQREAWRDAVRPDPTPDTTGLRWECGPHTNVWNGHDARCRKVKIKPDAGQVVLGQIGEHAEPEPVACRDCGKSATACGRSGNFCCAACSQTRFRTHDPDPTPEPDAGDVEALLNEAQGMIVSVGMDPDFGDLHSGVTSRQERASRLVSKATSLLAAYDAEVRRDTAERIAQAIATSVSAGFGMNHDGSEDSHAVAYVEGLRDAADIARDEATS